MPIFATENGSLLVFTTDITGLLQSLQDDFNFETVLRLLADTSEQQRVLALKDKILQIKSLVNVLFTRAVLNTVLDGHSDQPWKAIKFTHNKYGKPLLEFDGRTVSFNASTSNKVLCVVVEFSDLNSPVGVDLSHSQQDSISSTDFMEQFSPMFHSEERIQISQASSDSRYFLFNHLWTLKEALTKLLGCGLNIDLADICFRIEGSLSPSVHASKSIESQFVFNRLENNWFTNVNVNIENLVMKKSRFLADLKNDKLHCYSVVVRPAHAGELPVILTVMNQNVDAKIFSYHVDMEKLFQL